MKANSKGLLANMSSNMIQNANITEADPEGKTEMISIDRIDENPLNAKVFSMDKVDELARDINERGFQGAIIVWQKPDGRYEVVSGHQRLRAAKIDGMKTIRCFIKKYNETTRATDIINDLIRSNLNNREITAMEKSNAVALYMDNVLAVTMSGSSQEEKVKAAAEYFGISSGSILKLLGFQKLNPKLQVYANMKEFPIYGLDNTKKFTPEQIDNLINTIESTEGFKEYKNGEDGCPLSVRSLKAIVSDIAHSEIPIKPVAKNTVQKTEQTQTSFSVYKAKSESFRNDVLKCKYQDLTSEEVRKIAEDYKETFEILEAYTELREGKCEGKNVADRTDIPEHILEKLSEAQLKNLMDIYSKAHMDSAVNLFGERYNELIEKKKKAIN